VKLSERRYRFGPLEQRAVVGPLRAGQVGVIGAAALLGLGSMYALRSFWSLLIALVALLAAAACVFVPIEGRSAEGWAPVALRWMLRGRGGYRSDSIGAGFRLDAEGQVGSKRSLPAQLAGVELLEVPYGSEQVGVLVERRVGTYTAVLAVRAGSFGLLDPAEQERKLEAWGAVLASCARDGSPVRRLQWVERTVPGDGDELASHLQEGRDRGVPIDSSLVRSYIELIESGAPASEEHEILLALQIDQKRGSRELRRLGGGKEASCSLLLREAEGLAERLALAELSVYGVLAPRQLAAVIRDGFDPFGRQGRARAHLGEPDRAGVDPALAGPTAAETDWATYRSDSALHATYWIAGWPRAEVGPAFLTPLLMQSGALRTVAVTIEPTPYSVAMRKAEAAQTAEVAEELARERQGFMTTARMRRKAQASARREEELADGHAEMRFAGYITVSAPGREELERSCGEVEHTAQLARLELQRLYGEQEAGFAFTLPLGRGLR
jgi:hypothetical protein